MPGISPHAIVPLERAFIMGSSLNQDFSNEAERSSIGAAAEVIFAATGLERLGRLGRLGRLEGWC
jgi:hypothetical protein